LSQWLLENGIPIFIAVVIGVVLIFFAIRLSKFLSKKIVLKVLPGEQDNSQKVFSIIFSIILAVIIAFPVISFVVSRFNVDVTPVVNVVVDWLVQHGIIIAVIVLGAYMLNKILSLLLPSLIHRVVKVKGKKKSAKEDIKKRSDTLSRFLTNMISVLIIVLALFMILSEIGVDIGPLLVGAGFVGVAVGLGGQKLISDVLNGLFIIIEDYYSKGDVVKIAGIAGLVEDVNIRRTILRDLDGIVHIVPNSQIDVASNFTKNWSRVNLNVSVAYGEDLDRVIEVANRVGRELARDKVYGPMLITPPQVLRVDNLGDSGIDIKILGDTKPMKQWDVTGELRKRIKKTFDEEGIEIPWPHTKVYFGDAPVEHEKKISPVKEHYEQPPNVAPTKRDRRNRALPPEDE